MNSSPKFIREHPPLYAVLDKASEEEAHEYLTDKDIPREDSNGRFSLWARISMYIDILENQ